MTFDIMNFKALKAPFEPNDIEWRIQQSGSTKQKKPWAKVIPYVTNRAIQDRLDDVCTPPMWENKYRKAPDGGILCGISINYSGVWITKWDGAENTQIESVKGGLSGAMKRAAVQWGIGRYLYDLEEGWAVFHEEGRYKAKIKQLGQWFNWDPPPIPEWAIPEAHRFLVTMKGYAMEYPEEYKAVLKYWEVESAKGVTDPATQQGLMRQVESEIWKSAQKAAGLKPGYEI